MKRMFSNSLKIVIGCCCLILIGAVFFYFMHFQNAPISNSTSDWGAFSDYLSPYIALASLILIGFITVFINRTNLLVEKPTLAFEINDKRERYNIKNIGKGAALNLVVKHKNDRKSNSWDSNVLCYSLGPNSNLEIFWKKGGDEWIVYYDDIFENHYFSNIKDDYVQIGKIESKAYEILKNEKRDRIWNVKTID